MQLAWRGADRKVEDETSTSLATRLTAPVLCCIGLRSTVGCVITRRQRGRVRRESNPSALMFCRRRRNMEIPVRVVFRELTDAILHGIIHPRPRSGTEIRGRGRVRAGVVRTSDTNRTWLTAPKTTFFACWGVCESPFPSRTRVEAVAGPASRVILIPYDLAPPDRKTPVTSLSLASRHSYHPGVGMSGRLQSRG